MDRHHVVPPPMSDVFGKAGRSYLAKVQLPADYPFPPHVANRPRDFKLSWFCIKELGVAAIPPTEFFTDDNAHLAEDWLRFAVCKPDDVLDTAKERLRGLRKFMRA